MTATATATPYGYCPTCGAPGKYRERRFNGDDHCENGHAYHWHVYSPGPYNPLTEPPKCAVTGKTEAEALVAALEVAP